MIGSITAARHCAHTQCLPKEIALPTVTGERKSSFIVQRCKLHFQPIIDDVYSMSEVDCLLGSDLVARERAPAYQNGRFFFRCTTRSAGRSGKAPSAVICWKASVMWMGSRCPASPRLSATTRAARRARPG